MTKWQFIKKILLQILVQARVGYTKEVLKDLKRETDYSTVIIKAFNVPPSMLDRLPIGKINKVTFELNHTGFFKNEYWGLDSGPPACLESVLTLGSLYQPEQLPLNRHIHTITSSNSSLNMNSPTFH
jgi:hypothetical protein